MDVLKDKQYETYSYTSRYKTVPFYYHTVDDKYIYGIGSNINKDITYVAHKVTSTDTLDSLALKYYGNPTLYWVIALFNDIQDCFIKLSDIYEIIKIPNISSISFGKER